MSNKPKRASDLDYSQPGELKALIDWVSFSFPYHFPIEDVFNKILRIPQANFEEDERGQNGYSVSHSCNHIRVRTDARTKDGTLRTDMGHSVELTGQGCREFELFNGDDWSSFFKRILDAGGKFSRLDVAVDDFHGYFTVSEVIDLAKSGQVISKFRTGSTFSTFKLDGSGTEGVSAYFGSKTSDIFINMYEKNYQQNVQDEVPIWNRTEVRMRRDNAHEFAMHIANLTDGEGGNGLFLKFGQVINNYLRFVHYSPELHKNKSRCRVRDFWKDFIGHADTLQLSTKRPDRTIESVTDYILNQVSRNLALVAHVNPDKVEEAILKGLSNFTREDEQLIEEFVTIQQNNAEYMNLAHDLVKKNLTEKRPYMNLRDDIDRMAFYKAQKNIPISVQDKDKLLNLLDDSFNPY